MSQELVTYQEKVGALSVADVRGQTGLIHAILKEVMQEDQHYGKIPGTDKPTLLKAGAEKLCLTFRLDPQYEIEQQKDGAHLTIVSKCTLYHIPSGQRFGSGMGSCSTKESKYAYRKASRRCPHCGSEAIIKGKDFKNDGKPTGWICYAKKGGCGAKFLDGDKSVEEQATGRVPNEDIADTYNTVLKMANKRSLVAAVLNTTAASDIFTQDIEDMPAFTESAPAPAAGTQTSSPDASGAEDAGAPLMASPEQIEAMHAALSEADLDIQKLLAKAEIKSLSDMPAEDVPGAIRWINKQKRKS